MTTTPPRTRNRASGWTPARQEAFLAALLELGSAERAAVAVGLSASSAYRLRKQPRGAEFAAAWDATLAEREARFVAELFERLQGKREPAYYRGRVIGERVIASDRLLLRVLDRTMARRPRPDPAAAAARLAAAIDRLGA